MSHNVPSINHNANVNDGFPRFRFIPMNDRDKSFQKKVLYEGYLMAGSPGIFIR